MSNIFKECEPLRGESAKAASWQEFFKLADRTEIPPDFMVDRADLPEQERNLF
ncbi:AbrB/MazE/SpoVT family DNA-binding domain-containing protein [Verminephrobacter aporrectodeae]|uniref:hypothetical protein n=1 Tax=Verminephrobacter aporrectodeae TaxID=1110389 RepID=UPI0022432E76|nr:hypothetical protein [Verminephrobacter aporrectodeae]